MELRSLSPGCGADRRGQRGPMMKSWRSGLVAALAVATSASAGDQPSSDALVTKLKVTVLSTMLAGNPGAGIGEWGFAALVEADGRRLLVDTGARPETVLRNAAELGIDLSKVTDVVITHNHRDHTGGLIVLRRELAKQDPRALSRAHVASKIFLSRLSPDGKEENGLLPIKAAYEDLGGVFTDHPGPLLSRCLAHWAGFQGPPGAQLERIPTPSDARGFGRGHGSRGRSRSARRQRASS